MSTRLKRLFTGIICLVLVNVLLVYSLKVWRGTSNFWFFRRSNLSPVEREWNRLHNVGQDSAAISLREMAAKGLLPYNDSYLIRFVREKLLLSPNETSMISPATGPPKNYSQYGQDRIIDELLKHRKNGFFIEAGAYDGVTFSNTYFLEKERNWTGLLVEGDPNLFNVMKTKNRRAYLSNTCLSTTPYATTANFTFANALGGIKATNYKEFVTGSALIQCIPFVTYLLALDLKHVDYFSLDVEGTEPEVLRHIDFRRFQIDVLSIEYAGYGEANTVNNLRLEEIRNIILNTTLYYEVTTVAHQDVIFMRNITST